MPRYYANVKGTLYYCWADTIEDAERYLPAYIALQRDDPFTVSNVNKSVSQHLPVWCNEQDFRVNNND